MQPSTPAKEVSEFLFSQSVLKMIYYSRNMIAKMMLKSDDLEQKVNQISEVVMQQLTSNFGSISYKKNI